MHNRHNADSSQPLDGSTGEYQPERVETAEFTMHASAEPEATGTQTEETDPSPENRVFDREQVERRRAEWDELQAGFIDDPHRAVGQADRMISDTIDDITRALAREREQLEQEWKDAEDAGTEDLRVSFQRYRRLLDRLLSL